MPRSTKGAGPGIAWWSDHDPDWTSCGLWCAPGASTIDGLTLVDIEPLDGGHPAVTAAARSLLRVWT